MASEQQNPTFEPSADAHRFIGHKNAEGYAVCARCKVHENDRALERICPGPSMSDVIVDLMRQNAKADGVTLDQWIRSWLEDSDAE